MNALCPLFLMFTLSAAADSPFDRARMELLLFKREDDIIIAAFKRHSDHVLPFIDSYLEGGLKMIEEGKPEDDVALASFSQGVRFSKLADRTFGGVTFKEYATNFASWNAKERKQFRAGQKAYRAGRQEKDPAKALAHFEQSLRLAESLGDTWGRAMALAAVAQANEKMQRHDEACESAANALVLFKELGLRQDGIEVLLVEARCCRHGQAGGFRGFGSSDGSRVWIHRRDFAGFEDSQLNVANEAWSALRPDDDAKLRQAVFDTFHELLKSKKMTEDAERLRKKYEAMNKEKPEPKKDETAKEPPKEKQE